MANGDVYRIDFGFKSEYYYDEDGKYFESGYRYCFSSFLTFVDIANFTL